MRERHPDAHWDCDNCGLPLIRTRSVTGPWVYTSAINGERYCREPVGSKFPDWPHHVSHTPYDPDLTTIETTEEYLAR